MLSHLIIYFICLHIFINNDNNAEFLPASDWLFQSHVS